MLESQLDELDTRYMAQWLLDIRQAQIINDEIAHVQERLARARERVAELVIRSRAEGVFEVPDAANLPGRFVRQGTALGYVLDLSALTARIVVPEAEVELVRQRTRRIELRAGRPPAPNFHHHHSARGPCRQRKTTEQRIGQRGRRDHCRSTRSTRRA